MPVLAAGGTIHPKGDTEVTDVEFNRLLSEPDKLSGGYLFFGEEDFMKSRYADRFQKAIVGDDTFSAISIEGMELTPSELAQALGSVSMFGGRRFVRVDHAPVGKWKKAKKKDAVDQSEADGDDGLLDEYLAIFESAAGDSDVAYCITVDDGAADFGDVAKNKVTALYKKLTEHLTPVYFGAKGGAQLRKWIERHFLAAGLNAEYTAAETLISISGQDMFTLTGECEKLIAYAKAKSESTVTADMVRYVASPTLVEEAFERDHKRRQEEGAPRALRREDAPRGADNDNGAYFEDHRRYARRGDIRVVGAERRRGRKEA